MILLRAVLSAGLAYAVIAIAADPVPSTIDPPTSEAVVQSVRDTKALTQPDAFASIAFDVPKGMQLTWIAQQKSTGFYRVTRLDTGPQGWVAIDDVELVQPHLPTPPESLKKCAASLDACPVYGCAEKGSPEAVANELKRSIPTSPLKATLSFGDFLRLQQIANGRIRQGPPDVTMQERKTLSDMPLENATVSERDRVRTLGYIAKGGQGLHVNKDGESVNCMLKGKKDNDFHIPIVEHPGDTERQGIVVEMIPQGRPPEWNIDVLKGIQAQGAQVWVEGALSYDNVHYVNSDLKHSIKDEPDRMSLWEIHPVTKFLVCRKDHCDPNLESDWLALSQVQPQAGDAQAN